MVNRADRRGLRSSNNDYVIALLDVIECPVNSEKDYSDFMEAGIDWLYKGTKDSSRSLAVANSILLDEVDNIVEKYLRSYVGRFMKENKPAVDGITNSIRGIAQLAFDPRTPQG